MICLVTICMVLVIPIYHGNVPFTNYRGFTFTEESLEKNGNYTIITSLGFLPDGTMAPVESTSLISVHGGVCGENTVFLGCLCSVES